MVQHLDLVQQVQLVRPALLVVVHQLGVVDLTSVVHNLGVVSHRGVTLNFLVLNIFVSLKLDEDEDVKDDNDETNDALTYDGDDVDDGSECAIELSLKQIEHFVKALNLHSYPLYPTKMWSKQ